MNESTKQRNDFIPIARPCLGEEEAEAARRVILSGWVTQGPEVEAFAQEFAEYVGTEHACAVSNCTSALHLALKAVGVGPGDEVITVSHSFIATANAIRYCGATPVFVDIDASTFNMDPLLVEDAITDRTKAILCAHQMGMPCDLKALLTIARKHGMPLVEDAACAIGSEIDFGSGWERIGKPHGDIACFSFHPRKIITTGDGGMLTTTSEEYDRKFRLWRQHGMSIPDVVRHGAEKVAFEEYVDLGYNYRMTDIQAAVGRVQLGRLAKILAKRRRLAEEYRRLLKSVQDVVLPVEPVWARSNWQSFCVRLPRGCEQAVVMQVMRDRGIATRRGIMCAHLSPVYAVEPARWPLGESEAAHHGCILLPLHDGLGDRELQRVAEELALACAETACHR